jgi:parallel beta-helix repeat protein
MRKSFNSVGRISGLLLLIIISNTNLFATNKTNTILATHHNDTSNNYHDTSPHPAINIKTAKQGLTYYCDPISGKNSNTGSSTQPFGAFSSVNWKKFDLQAGDVIYLMSGQHGQAYMTSIKPNNYITIRAMPGHQPVLSGIQLNNSQFLYFDGLLFDATGTSRSKTRALFHADNDTHHIRVENSTLQSAADSSSWTKEDWHKYSTSGFQFRGDHIVLKNNVLKNLYHAIELQGDYSIVQNNIIDNFAGDAIRSSGSFSTYENNLVKDCYIDEYDFQQDHAFRANSLGGDGKIEHVTLRNNTFIVFSDPITPFIERNKLVGSMMQGIVITDGYADNWIVENNLVVNNQNHGISLYGARYCRIQNNTIIQSPLFADTTHTPMIMLTDQKKTGQKNFSNIIRNNLAAFYTWWTYDRSSLIENNTQIEWQQYANYSKYFVDYDKGDYRSIKTSPAIDAGINTDASKTDIAGNNRIYGKSIDAGAVEYHKSVSP